MNAHIIEAAILNPRRRLWTVDEFERAGEFGLFAPDERLELIEGEIISKVTPQSPRHACSITLADYSLRDILPAGYYVRIQMPMTLGPRSQPEPDLTVMPGEIRDALISHPSTAALVVEIADTSLRLDRHAKASLYARAAVPEYWIVNIPDRVLEVHRDPIEMEDQPYGFHYRSITRHSPSDKVSPLIAPEQAILVSDILP